MFHNFQKNCHILQYIKQNRLSYLPQTHIYAHLTLVSQKKMENLCLVKENPSIQNQTPPFFSKTQIFLFFIFYWMILSVLNYSLFFLSSKFPALTCFLHTLSGLHKQCQVQQPSFLLYINSLISISCLNTSSCF